MKSINFQSHISSAKNLNSISDKRGLNNYLMRQVIINSWFEMMISYVELGYDLNFYLLHQIIFLCRWKFDDSAKLICIARQINTLNYSHIRSTLVRKERPEKCVSPTLTCFRFKWKFTFQNEWIFVVACPVHINKVILLWLLWFLKTGGLN